MAYTTIREGSRGEDVKRLQTLLNNEGYSLDVDGIFGEKTIWLSCALLLVSLCFMFIKEDLPEIEEELEK